MKKQNMICRLCGSDHLRLRKKTEIDQALSSKNFAITDSSYGMTLDIYLCEQCGLLQCQSAEKVLDFYVNLEDRDYEVTRRERAIQAEKIIAIFKKHKPSGVLFDIGAGSGILVEEALKVGYVATGIEPSKWLQLQAVRRKLPIERGIFDVQKNSFKYDIITLIDVIEHVEDPMKLLQDIRVSLFSEGILVITTPDVGSFFAWLFGWKWWHFRIAHITYFNRKTIVAMLNKAGFDLLEIRRPAWYFTLSYLFDRVMIYLPSFLRLSGVTWMKKIIIPLNLADSFLLICKVKPRI